MNNSSSLAIEDSIELSLLNHQQIHENIKFADQKAGAVIAADGTLLALTYAQIDPAKLPSTIAVGFIVCAILSTAIGLAFWVAKPRGEANRARGAGVIDSIRISLYSHEQFQAQMACIQADELLKEVLTLVYDRAYIDQKKYFYLRIALLISLVGWIAALLFAAWTKLYNIGVAPSHPGQLCTIALMMSSRPS